MSLRRHQPLRIAMVTPYFRPVVGGITTFVDSLTKTLQARGAEVRIWTQHGEAGPDVEKGPETPVRFVAWARKRLRLWKPDVIHAHAHWYALSSCVSWRGPLARRIVFTVHTDWDPIRNPLRERMLHRTLRRANVVTCLGPRSLDRIKARFHRLGNVQLLLPGFRPFSADPDRVARIRNELGITEAFPRLCAVSMMVWPEKVRGLEVLLRALPEVLNQHPRATLVFVGDGPFKSSLVAKAEALGLQDAVRFVGVQENPAPFILASDILVYCSFRDVFGQVVLEALSLGLPVVANYEVTANLPLDAEEMGIVSVAGSHASFATAIAALASDPSRCVTLGARGREIVTAEFSWERTADAALALYDLSV